MVSPGFTRWALILVLIALIIVLLTAATVVVASAILQPQVVPTIEVEPQVVAAGEIVTITGKGWPSLVNLVLVIALSPTRDLRSEGLLAVGAAPVALDGTIAATFVFPCEVPWTTLREAWVVVRAPTGDLHAAARIIVRRARPTPTPTVNSALTPVAGRQQIQGTIVRLALEQWLLTLRPFDGSPDRGVALRAAAVGFLDGRPSSLSELAVGLSVAVAGWPDSAGTLLAEQITILEVTSAAAQMAAQASVTARPPASVGALATPSLANTACPPVTVCVPATPCPGNTVCPPVTVCVPATPCPQATACPPTQVACAPPACATAEPIELLIELCTPIPTACPTVTPTPLPITGQDNRWVAEFFPNPSLSGPAVAVQENEVIDFDWRLGPPVPGLPREGYSVRWTGRWGFPRQCSYRFLLLLRGAARFSVDGQVLLDLCNGPPPAEYPAQARLTAGLHQLELDFRSTGKDPRVQLRWEYADAVP